MITCIFEKGTKAHLRHAVVDVLVLKEDKILLVRRTKRLLEGGKWGLVGGYVERTENLQEAAEREIFEETGYKIRDLTLLTIRHNADRPHEDRQNISFVFFCKALEKEGTADGESDERRWFGFDELPSEENLAFDHPLNIKLYLQYRKENFPLPVFKLR
ncbi:MAG: NUDIX hydrolase [Candidatus Levyibacteriota bacterium]